jgi:hypothetical protein
MRGLSVAYTIRVQVNNIATESVEHVTQISEQDIHAKVRSELLKGRDREYQGLRCRIPTDGVSTLSWWWWWCLSAPETLRAMPAVA